MNFKDIYQYFQSPPPINLGQEVAVCYILARLVDIGDSYGTALMHHLNTEHPPYRISDPVLYSALEFLMNEGIIQSYWHKTPGRGRPRRMLSIRSEKLDEAQRLAQLWHQYLEKDIRSATAELT